jgi:hypothetical protein
VRAAGRYEGEWRENKRNGSKDGNPLGWLACGRIAGRRRFR